jgi:ribosome recycling factor
VPSLLEGIKVPAYEGAPAMPLPQLGTIGVRDPQTLMVQLYDVSVSRSGRGREGGREGRRG